MHAFAEPPAHAAWRHCDSREGFEVLFISPRWRAEGSTSALDEGVPWAVRYAIDVSPEWITRAARVANLTAEVTLSADGAGRWTVDGERAPHLDGVLDVDLESSAFTNAFPVHRLGLAVGEAADAPAAWVRAETLAVERLEQRYERLDDDDQGRQRFHYTAGDFESLLVFDASGFVVDYPGIARRSGGEPRRS